MGILADIFVATPTAASEYEQSVLDGTAQQYERAEYKGFTGLEFGMLWAILEGNAWDVKRHMLENIAHGDSGEMWLDRFPEPLVQILANMSEQACSTASVTWSQSEELRGATPADLLPVLADLKRLASSAQETKREMYLWGSL